MMYKIKHTRGFILMLAALVASIVLALGSSIFTIAKKQVTLSSLGRDSQFAFYAADTAAECALYWDIRYAAFGATEPEDPISCAGEALGEVLTVGARTAPPYEIEFDLNLFVDGDGIAGTADDNGYCARVTVSKNIESPFTVIRSDGYSTPCTETGISARSLQRSVQLQY